MDNSWELYVKNSSIGGFVTATTEIKIYNLKHYKAGSINSFFHL